MDPSWSQILSMDGQIVHPGRPVDRSIEQSLFVPASGLPCHYIAADKNNYISTWRQSSSFLNRFTNISLLFIANQELVIAISIRW
jgi:hypothetical protein